MIHNAILENPGVNVESQHRNAVLQRHHLRSGDAQVVKQLTQHLERMAQLNVSESVGRNQVVILAAIVAWSIARPSHTCPANWGAQTPTRQFFVSVRGVLLMALLYNHLVDDHVYSVEPVAGVKDPFVDAAAMLPVLVGKPQEVCQRVKLVVVGGNVAAPAQTLLPLRRIGLPLDVEGVGIRRRPEKEHLLSDGAFHQQLHVRIILRQWDVGVELAGRVTDPLVLDVAGDDVGVAGVGELHRGADGAHVGARKHLSHLRMSAGLEGVLHSLHLSLDGLRHGILQGRAFQQVLHQALLCLAHRLLYLGVVLSLEVLHPLPHHLVHQIFVGSLVTELQRQVRHTHCEHRDEHE
mmetsp:Transcript_22845/g.53422  ORF Transcript_22845/g.53422 Transcript_22845/m.53422 type:complete len:351 (-) Transcript_22845:236-1288(-)